MFSYVSLNLDSSFIAVDVPVLRSLAEASRWERLNPSIPSRPYRWEYQEASRFYLAFIQQDAEKMVNIHDRLNACRRQLQAGERRPRLLTRYRLDWQAAFDHTECPEAFFSLYPHPELFENGAL